MSRWLRRLAQNPCLPNRLGQAVEYGEDKDRIRALGILEVIGPDAKSVVPSITSVLRNFNIPREVRQAATDALKKIDPSAMP
jgi:hypothetical protein